MRLNRKDRVALDELRSVYGTQAVMEAITSIRDQKTGLDEGNGNDDVILDYIMRLEGYRIRLRELHWQAEHNAEHKLTDALIGDLEKYEDEIAEDFMGIIGYRIQVGKISPILPDAENTEELIDDILSDTIDVGNAIGDDPKYKGISNVIDDAVHMLNKSKYLSTML